MTAPYIQQAVWTGVVFGISVAVFAVGEFSQTVKWRRGASRVDLRGEVLFRLLFFAGILTLPLTQAPCYQELRCTTPPCSSAAV